MTRVVGEVPHARSLPRGRLDAVLAAGEGRLQAEEKIICARASVTIAKRSLPADGEQAREEADYVAVPMPVRIASSVGNPNPWRVRRHVPGEARNRRGRTTAGRRSPAAG